MKNSSRTKQELTEEISILKKQIKKLEKSEAKRKQAEEALHLFKDLVEHSSDAIGMSTPEGRHYYQNEAFDRLFGEIGDCPPETVYVDKAIGRHVFDKIMGGGRWQGEVKMFKKDRSILNVFQRAYAIQSQDGRIIGLVGLHTDVTERKQAEVELSQEQLLMKILLDSLPGIFYLYSYPALRLIRWNKNHETLLGYGPGEIKDRSLLEWHMPEAREAVLEAVEVVMEKGQNIIESPLLTKDGRSIPFILTGVKVEVSGQKYLMGVGIETTDRKQAEKALRESEAKYRKAFHTNQDSININRLADGMYILINEGFTKLTGYTEADIAGRTSLEINVWENLADRERLVEGLRRDGKVENLEARFRKKDGVIGHGLMSASVITIDDIPHILSVTREITELKQAEDALRESEKRYRLIAENTADLISILDLNLRFTYVSPASMRLRGFTVEEAMEQTLEQVLTPESMQLGLSVFEKEMQLEASGTADPDRIRILELEEYRKDGSIIWMEVSLSFLRDKDHKPVEILIVSRDITARKQAEEEKVKLEGQLQQAQKMESVGRLAGGVAHDFNNMLGVILGHTELALMKMDPAQPLHSNLTEIHKAAERSADLTQQLLAFARKQTVAPKVLDLNEIVESMLKMLNRLIGEDINLKWQPQADLWPVKMDPSQIDQILANLCVNARDAIAGVGKMTIETGNTTLDEEYCVAHAGFEPGEYVRISVSDDGCGMDKETLSHLFEPFYTTKKMGKGTGLGLATVYGAVKQNDGFINVYSEPDQGTTFTIYLPRHKGKAGQMQQEDKAKPAARGRETILLVEDEPSILEITTTMLEMQGYTVLAASTPGEAIRLARERAGDIHLLMTDVVMPEMNGRDLAKNLLSLYPHLKRLFMSGYTANVIAHRGVLDEGVYFIQKPFSIKELAAKVREVLDRE